jgi:phage tail-like protein
VPVPLGNAPVASIPAAPPNAGADPQGGRYHLLAGRADWAQCREIRDGLPDPASPPQVWPQRPVLDDDTDGPAGNFEWDPLTGSLRLAHRDAVTRHTTSTAAHRPDQRRGADRDRYGSWYWISEDQRSVLRACPGARQGELWWSLDEIDGTCTARQRESGQFGTVPTPLTDDGTRLAGLAITTGHRLVVGLVDAVGGLAVFDLHSRGAPFMLRWPGEYAITPFDLAATSHGGVLVLDRTRRTWWRLDRNWRLQVDVQELSPRTFRAADGTTSQGTAVLAVTPRPHVLEATGQTAVIDPVAIAEGPGVVLVLDRPPAGPSAVVLCRQSVVLARLPLTVTALDPTRPDLPSFVHDVVGQDLVWAPANATLPLPGPLLYVADGSTSVTEAYSLDLDPPSVTHLPDELPMRSWESKGIVATGGDVYYDAVGRWVPLEPFGICNMERTGTLQTPAGFGEHAVNGQPFDSVIAGCAWHRLFLDAAIPDGCRIRVAARASDDPILLQRIPFRPQPRSYLRTGGAELPWHEPWSDVSRPTSPQTGTWELLFQQVQGRFMQLELTLEGTGRSTPSLRALRVWYPRFSYVHAYLPEVYRDEDEPGRFLERLLANMEGLLTEQENRIEQAWMLADPRTSPTTALDWLASWVGLHLEPAWTSPRRRFLLTHVDRLYRMRGTIGGLRALLRLYLGCSLDPDVVFATQSRTDDPARIIDRVAPHRFRVLIPGRLDTDSAAMVARIIGAARPAHASFEIRSFSGLFVVGEAQVGIDTLLGASPGFQPMVLGESTMPGLLGAPHPFEITDRIVSDRDRLGELPAL